MPEDVTADGMTVENVNALVHSMELGEKMFLVMIETFNNAFEAAVRNTYGDAFADIYFGHRKLTAIDLWETYQKSGSYEDMTRWLKHAAWERIEEEG